MDGPPGRDDRTDNSPRAVAGLAVLACGWLLLLLLANWRDRGPEIPRQERELASFSAARAETLLREIFEPEEPRPAGSAANARVRDRIQRLVEGWGYEVERQETELARRPGESPIPLTNLMFRLPGTANSGADLIVVAHYDSVPSGPGISDDASGVAIILELARMFRNSPRFANDVLFLLTDGEESGLLGARRFCSRHPWAKQVRAVINLEARGTSGPSLMFQTGAPNRWLIELFARSVTRPRTSSLFFEVYRFLPNDTDFTIFNREGINGFNFAFIGEVRNYHTPDDDLEHLSRRSLQHQGQNVWELLPALADADLVAPRAGNAVYFDFFSCWLVWWPSEWSTPLASSILLATLVCCWFLRRRIAPPSQPHSNRALSLRWLADGLAIVLAWAIVAGLGHLLAWDARLRFPWPEAAASWLLTYWLTTLALLLGLSRLLGPRGSIELRTAAVGLLWSLVSLAVAFFLPGASYLFLVPAGLLVLALGSMLAPNRLLGWVGLMLATVSVGCLWIPNERLFCDALGFAFPLAVAFRPAVAGSILLPWFGQLDSRAAWRLGMGLVISAVCFAISAIAQNR